MLITFVDLEENVLFHSMLSAAPRVAEAIEFWSERRDAPPQYFTVARVIYTLRAAGDAAVVDAVTCVLNRSESSDG